MGAGSIGLCMLAAAKAIGLKDIVVVATTDKRLKIAREMGAVRTIASREENVMEVMQKLRPEGTDVVIDATGIEECIQQSLKLAKRGGTVALAGYGRGKIMNIRISNSTHMMSLI